MEHEEVAICRVCRGEATTEEPLFYPCRCSGSIKYVHQDCLVEWLAHSNKRYCELCKHEYTFTPVYDPNMPETIPKRIIAQQMLQNVARTILAATRATLVMAVWFMVLPYIVYWLTRFYFWSGGQAEVPLLASSDDAESLAVDATSAAANAAIYAVGTASVRFIGFSSWHEWYEYARANNTLTPIVSRTGVLDGATSTALVLYKLTQLLIRPSSQLLSRMFGISVSDEWMDGAVDSVAELAAKCIEGGVVTVVTIMLFMALFILRDWITANAPVHENLVDELGDLAGEEEVEEPEPQAEELPPPPPPLPPLPPQANHHNHQAQVQVHGQPVVVENPHLRPMFERLALFEDHLPDEQPVAVQRARSHDDEDVNDNVNSDDNDDDNDDDDDAEEYAYEDADNAWSVVSTSELPNVGGPSRLRRVEDRLPTFTAESSRGITARISSSSSSSGGSSSDSSIYDDNNNNDREALLEERYQELVEARRANQQRWEEQHQLLVQRQQQLQQQLEQQQQQQQQLPEEPDGGNQPPPAAAAENADMDEDNLDGVDGMLEAMRFRGRVVDAAQYFVLVLSMVSLVLACLAWIPFIVGRGFVSLNPVRWALYTVYVCTATVDAVSEFVLDRLLPVAEASVNLLGPVLVFLVPGAGEALLQENANANGGDGPRRLWDQLGSAVLLQHLRQSWAMRVLFPWASASASASSASMPPTATGALLLGGDLAGLDPAITGGERDVWRRLVRWGVPVDGAAAWLQRATAAATLGERLAMVGVGHAVLLLAAWAFVAHAPRGLRRSAAYAQARVAVLMAKVAYFIVVELALFPALCGLCLAASAAPVLQPIGSVGGGGWARVAALWLAGLGFMVHFARFVLYCRQVLRPGVLWFIRDPNDPEFHPMREILEDRMAPQQYKIGRSAAMYCAIIAACVLAPAHLAARVAPPGMLPIALPDSALALGAADDVARHAWLVLLLPAAVAWGRPFAAAQLALDWWWRVAARATRLTEFMLGERDVLDEGQWQLRAAAAPWGLLLPLPGPVARLWAPADAVRRALAELELEALDEARAGPVAQAVPSHTYRAQLQAAVDRALAGSAVRLALDGGLLRVPATDTVAIVAGRRMLVPVDAHGRPADARHDYEAADYPDQRDPGSPPPLAPPAPASSYRDQRFRRADHTVVYAPPALRVRLAAFVALGWAAVAALFVCALALALASGRALCRRMRADDNDLLALGVGLLCVVLACAAAARAATLAAAIGGRADGGAAAVARGARRAWAATWRALVTCAAFLGAVPLACGLMAEVYVGVALRQALSAGSQSSLNISNRSLGAAAAHNWMFGVVQLWVAHAALRFFFPESRAARELARVFAGAPHEWLVARALLVFALPAVGLALAFAALPFALVAAAMCLQHRLSKPAFARVVALDDTRQLAAASCLVALAVLACAVTWQATRLYKRWTRSARDRVYLVGQLLHNLPASERPTPSGADEYEAVAGETVVLG